MVPVTPAEFVEHPLSIALESVDVGPGAVTVTVAGEALSAAKRASASFARLASTPVPAAKPMTAVDKRAMIMDRINTSTEHPNIRCGALPCSDGSIGPYPV